MADRVPLEDMPNRLRYWRKQRGYSLQSLAKEIGCTFAHLARMETGERELLEVWLQRIGDRLDVYPADLLRLKDGGLTEDERHMIETFRQVPEAIRATYKTLTECYQAFRDSPDLSASAPKGSIARRKRG